MVVIWVKKFQTELMVEIYSKSLVLVGYDFARTPIKTHKGDENWLFWWSASITLDNNKDVLTGF